MATRPLERKNFFEALLLPLAARRRRCSELLASLDDVGSDDVAKVEAAWTAEIERRARRVMAGESAGIRWEDLRRRAEAELRNREAVRSVVPLRAGADWRGVRNAAQDAGTI